jgi:hypothetical protein
MQHLNNSLNRFKVNDLIHVYMLIFQKMWKNSLNHSNANGKHQVTCVSIYFNKCNARCNLWVIILTYYKEWFNSCTHVENWWDLKQIINPFQYKCAILSCYMSFNKLW